MHGGHLAALALTHATRHHTDIGKAIRDWGIFAATLIAAIGAVWAAGIAARAYARQGDDTRRAQASRVAAQSKGRETGRWPPVVEIYNGSDLAVYDVMTWVFGPNGWQGLGDEQARIILAGRNIEVHTIAAGQIIESTWREPDALPRFDKIEVVFSDENGHRWIRTVDGPLREVPTHTWPLKMRLRAPFLNARERLRGRRADG